ncbi:hypothetical protein FRACYDRAFT_244994 [Fragilariopsis cylindrus CCMP1102]|uniref:Uncharacterized protein n=1 Tax=Fragilariopsis cylindrus CCMP1102 TaxID=635003 RepID=A0A1E7F193_9STRA|nr:hypothetical protein FRACYDRAFT_244994 [Fragilariopsis cylindrus CCMP1102]|eukprot:OEU11874.1 hypothetical protein FRACYDRAFT_244994 [Fragilariopsis cylindrus CCMP1102]
MSSSLQPLRALSFSVIIPPRPLSLALSSTSTSTSTSTSSLSLPEQIQIPTLKTIPLPFKLLGGLFLFAGSVKDNSDKKFSQNILQKAEEILRIDPLISMELGLGIEAGGIFASSKSTQHHYQIMIMEFQLNGGNAWAQARVCGIQKINAPPEDGNEQVQEPDSKDNEIQLISLGVANMDASLNGGWAEVKLPPITIL